MIQSRRIGFAGIQSLIIGFAGYNMFYSFADRRISLLAGAIFGGDLALYYMARSLGEMKSLKRFQVSILSAALITAYQMSLLFGFAGQSKGFLEGKIILLAMISCTISLMQLGKNGQDVDLGQLTMRDALPHFLLDFTWTRIPEMSDAEIDAYRASTFGEGTPRRKYDFDLANCLFKSMKLARKEIEGKFPLDEIQACLEKPYVAIVRLAIFHMISTCTYRSGSISFDNGSLILSANHNVLNCYGNFYQAVQLLKKIKDRELLKMKLACEDTHEVKDSNINALFNLITQIQIAFDKNLINSQGLDKKEILNWGKIFS